MADSKQEYPVSQSGHPWPEQQGGFKPQPGTFPQQPGADTQPPGTFSQQHEGFSPQGNSSSPRRAFPSQQGRYPPQQVGFSAQDRFPEKQGGYPPPQEDFSQQQVPYPSQLAGFPPKQALYPPQEGGYPLQHPEKGGYPAGYLVPPMDNQPVDPVNIGFVPQVPPYAQQAPNPGLSPAQEYRGLYGDDAEDPFGEEIKGFGFDDKSIRRNFIKKVYGILSVQLLITVAFIAWFLYDEPTKLYVQQHVGILIAAIVLAFVVLIAMACCPDVRRRSPMNYIFLFIFTIAEGFMVAAATSTYQVEEVIIAAGITTAVCLALTLFAFQTKWDFTMCGGVLFVGLVIMLIFGIVAACMPGKILELVYSSCGALLFSMYLVYDTQIMMGGNHKYSLSPEEYIFAALNLYLDIINLFMYILRILAAAKK